jgi:hypothetical protein
VPKEGLILGKNIYRDEETLIRIKKDDRRRHIYIIGKTGTGKSVLISNMAIQDIQAGRGVAFVDPHGESAEKLLDFIPPKRVNDVIYFNPADIEYPIAFNVMEKVDNNTVRSGHDWSVKVPSIHELKYFEGNKSLTLEIEGARDKSGIRWYVYQPAVWAWDGNPDDPFLDAVKIQSVKKRIREALTVLDMEIKEFT